MNSSQYVPPQRPGLIASLLSRHVMPFLRYIDYPLIICVVGLALIGIWVLKGAVQGTGWLESAGSRQLMFFWVALVALMGTCFVDYRWINRVAILLYGVNIVALLYVLILGAEINGAKSWIPLGPINWQPSETMKVATVLVCARWLALYPERVRGWPGTIIPGMICGIPAVLVLAQPDLGSASLFFLLYMAMMLMSSGSIKKLLVVLFAAIIGAGCVFPFLKPYQKERLVVFIAPENYPDSPSAYNLLQAKVAIGSGGFWGDGWGEGTQGVHRFLPEHYTDFIFASTIEQFGLIGGIVVLGLFALTIWRMFHAMDKAKDRFGGIVVAGMIAIFTGHIIINIGMNVGLLPITGIPLPFFSYGGSFLVTIFVMFGLVLNVASRRFTFVLS